MKLRFLLPAATAIAFAAPVFAQQQTPPGSGEGMGRMEQMREHMPMRGDDRAHERHAQKRKHGGRGDMHETMHMMMMHQMMHQMMHGDDDDSADCPMRDGPGMMERHGMMQRHGMMDQHGARGPRSGMGSMEGRGQMRAEMAAQLAEMQEQIAKLQQMIEAMAAEEEETTEPGVAPKE